MEVVKSLTDGFKNLVNGNNDTKTTDTEEIMANPKIVDKDVNTDKEPEQKPEAPVQQGGMNDPNSAYWEAEYYKYKHLYLKETGR